MLCGVISSFWWFVSLEVIELSEVIKKAWSKVRTVIMEKRERE